MIKYIERYPITSIVLFGFIMLLPNLDAFVLTIMEARNFITAREMVIDGNWFQTTMNGIARYEKPPLPTWLSAFSGMVFGINNLFALRLPAALMIIFSAVYTYKLSIKLNLSIELSLINSFILLTSFYIIAIIIEAPWDIFTHGFAIAAIYYFIDLLNDSKHAWKATLLAGLFMGFSFLSKGPIGLYAIFLPFIIAYLYFYRVKEFKTKVKYILAFLLIFIVIGGSWHFYLELTDPVTLYKITDHETDNWHSYNVKPFYYYWNFFIQSGMWAIMAFISLIYPYIRKKVSQLKEYKFIMVWIITTLILLSVIPEKKSRYLVPILFPLAISTGFYIEYLIKSFVNLKSFKEKFFVYFNFYLFGVFAIVAPITIYILFKDNIDREFLSYLPFSIVMITVGFYILKSIYTKDIKKAFYLKIMLMGVILTFGLPFIKFLNKNNLYNDINTLHTVESKYHIKSYFYNEIAPEMIWYYNGKIDELNSLNSFEKDSIGLLINVDETNNLSKIPIQYNIEKVKQFNGNYFKKERNRLVFDYYLISKRN